MEKNARVVTVSYNDVESDIPIVRTIKCEGDGFLEPTRIDHHTMNILETSIDDEESNVIDEYGDQTRYLSIESDLQFISVKNMVGVFKCFRCDFSCTSVKDLIKHYQQYRKREPYTCFQCGYVGEEKLDFIEHSRGHFENIYYRCSKCTFRADSCSAIKRHIQEHTHEPSVSVEKFPCPLCDKKLESKLSFVSHLNSCKALLKDISNRAVTLEVKEKKEQKSNLKSSKKLDEKSSKVVIKEEFDEGKANPVYTCPHCFFIFSSKYKRSMHIFKAHVKNKSNGSKNVHDVDEENEVSEDEFKVGSDMNPSVQLERIYLCPVCHFVFTSVSSLNSHVITHKSVTECPICKLDCKTNFDLKEHMTSHSTKSPTSKFSCSSCDKKFRTLGRLKYHMKDEHSEGLKCPYCPRFMKSESALKVHIEAHSKMKEYYCPKCKFTAKNSALLQYHMSRFHPNKKKFTCEICDKAYMYKYSLQRHRMNCPGKDMESGSQKDEKDEATHEIEIDISQKEKLSCSECKATFKEAAHLKRHLLVHFHKTPYRCMKCGLRCKTKHALTSHMKIHNFKAHYQCKDCDQKFKSRHALNNHSVLHSEKRPYCCEVCGISFKRKANYRRHYDIHSEVKPFKCPHCDFNTKRKDGLYKHMEIHQKLK